MMPGGYPYAHTNKYERKTDQRQPPSSNHIDDQRQDQALSQADHPAHFAQVPPQAHIASPGPQQANAHAPYLQQHEQDGQYVMYTEQQGYQPHPADEHTYQHPPSGYQVPAGELGREHYGQGFGQPSETDPVTGQPLYPCPPQDQDSVYWSHRHQSPPHHQPDQDHISGDYHSQRAHDVSLTGQRPPSPHIRQEAYYDLPPSNRRQHRHQDLRTKQDSAWGRYDAYQDQEPVHPPRRPKTKRYKRSLEQQQIQVVLPDTGTHKDDRTRSISEQMQMMMMNQMMAQQMSAQQMQFAQMNAMLKKDSSNNQGSSSDDGAKEKRKNKKKKPTVNNKSKQMKRPAKAVPIIALPPQAAALAPPANTIEAAAMENWQEASIILCFAIIGVIYLVMNRSTKEEEKEASLAARHLVPKPK